MAAIAALLFAAFLFCSLDTIICSSTVLPLCHGSDRLALFQFKHSFTIDQQASTAPYSYPRTNLWNMSDFADCCFWDGVECDPRTGHVTGLNLASSYLHGSIDSNTSSLFNLAHLRSLDLSDNNFSFSSIPSQFDRLTQLTHLNLSSSWFFGNITSEISKLSQLSTLDLSYNYDALSDETLLELGESDFKILVQNLTNLKHLHLSYVNIDSPVPKGLANLSALISLQLSNCQLFGEFPASVFQLPSLQVIDISYNLEVTGPLPEFHSDSEIKKLNVAYTNLSGEIPGSIGNLNTLEQLMADSCNLSGPLPISIANLTKLSALHIGYNRLTGDMHSFWPNLTGLSELQLRTNYFNPGGIPPSFASLTNLQLLNLEDLSLTGGFPLWLTNLTQLKSLGLGNNSLQGSLPSSISRLKNLVSLHVNMNNFSGVLDLGLFLELEHLKFLYLGRNRWSSLIGRNQSWVASARLHVLDLSQSILNEFPEYLLKGQDQLETLDLSSNNIHGEIPDWLTSKVTSFLYLDLSDNFLTSFHENHPDIFLSQPDLVFLDLSSNMLQGLLPIPPPSVVQYRVFGNSFRGGISQQFCQMSSIQYLDVSNNYLSGLIPDCLVNLSEHLEVLDLHGNNFHGSMPSVWQSGNNVKGIRLGQNNFQGKVSRSLCNCKMLELLDLGSNQISDAFPYCLGNLPELKILILSNNSFHGSITTALGAAPSFPKLRIIDLSNNKFSGALSAVPFGEFNAMKGQDVERLSYMSTVTSWSSKMMQFSNAEYVSITLNNKGIKMNYTKVIEVFVAIDLSCNKFEGKIPDSLQQLKGLRLLNLSNNILSGQIPSSMGVLAKLEALDISQNKLVGQIPSQLTQLNFLEVFNVSCNNLTGPIPQGKQFSTFLNSSFDNNQGLCGVPLSIVCEGSKSPSATEQHEDHFGLLGEGFGWKAVAMGYGGGLAIGLGVGYYEMFRRKRAWLLKLCRLD